MMPAMDDEDDEWPGVGTMGAGRDGCDGGWVGRSLESGWWL